MDENTSFDKRGHHLQKTAILVKVTCALDLRHKFAQRTHHRIGGAAKFRMLCCIQTFASSRVDSSRLQPFFYSGGSRRTSGILAL